MSCLGAPAGFVMGPRTLKIVLIPSSLLGLETAAIAGWNLGANMNPNPTSSMHLATSSGSKSIFTPKLSRMSALPHLLDTDLFPCFATGTPQEATTNAAAVETLNVPLRSPPVPQVSTSLSLTSSLSGTFLLFSLITLTAPAISSTVSPLLLKATRIPAI